MNRNMTLGSYDDLDWDYFVDYRDHQEKNEKNAKFSLIASLVASGPVCRLRLLSSLRMITPEQPFRGYWIDNTSTGEFVKRGLTMVRIVRVRGFALHHGGHLPASDVWVGDSLQQLREIKETLGLRVTDGELRDLVRHGGEVQFLRAKFTEPCLVYQLSQEQASLVSSLEHRTELAETSPEGRNTRPVRAGDKLLWLPPRWQWPNPIQVYPADWNPPIDQYRNLDV